MTASKAAKAHRLLEQRRVLLIAGTAEATVIGDGGVHQVIAGRLDVVRTCIAGSGPRPWSHALAAMVVWHEAAG